MHHHKSSIFKRYSKKMIFLQKVDIDQSEKIDQKLLYGDNVFINRNMFSNNKNYYTNAK